MTLYIHPDLRDLLISCSLCPATEVPEVLLKHLLIVHQFSQNDAYSEIEHWQQTAFNWVDGKPYVECDRHGDYPASSPCYPCDHD